MITGGVASVIYGDPRFTRDVDIVLELRDDEVEKLTAAFADGDFYLPPVEVLREEIARETGGHFNIIHRDTALRADVYLRGNEPLHDWGLSRRHRLELDTSAIWVAPIEYVILRKCEYYRASGSERHLRDIAMMLRISGELIDRSELGAWSDRLDVKEVLEAARQHPLSD